MSMTMDVFSDRPNAGANNNTKSRKGCSECKRKRVKCDENKPVCSRCQKARHAKPCDYGLKLSWTQGRPFKKRRLDTAEDSSLPRPAISHDSPLPGWSTLSNLDNAAPSDNAVGMERRAEAGDSGGQLIKRPLTSATLPSASHQSSWGLRATFDHSSYPGPTGLLSESQGSTTPPEHALSGDINVEYPIEHTPSQFEDAPDDDSLDVINRDTEDVEADDVSDEVEDLGSLELVRSSPSPIAAIPPSLSTYPLLCPSESPNAYFFLHHYSVHTAATLFPLLPSASRDSLLSVAASNPNLLSALLSISAAQYGRLRGDSNPHIANRAFFFSRKALTGLQKAMADPVEATTFSTISTVLALCTNDILMSGNVQGWKTHLRGAKQLLTLAIGKSRESTTVTDPSKLFLIKWFAALDMFAGISSLTKTLVPDGRYWSIGSIADGSTPHVDDMVGFSLELMPILSRISRMARLQQRKTSLASSLGAEYTEVADDLDSLLADNVQHTEQQLTALFSRVSSPSIADAFPAVLAEETQDTHQLFVYAALLHLYRRVQELPKTHVKPEHATSKIIEIIHRLRPESPASIVILWPLFSAGCETDDPVRRDIIEARMKDLRRYGMGNVDQALDAMREYWRSDTCERWDVFLGQRGVDLVLF